MKKKRKLMFFGTGTRVSQVWDQTYWPPTSMLLHQMNVLNTTYCICLEGEESWWLHKRAQIKGETQHSHTVKPPLSAMLYGKIMLLWWFTVTLAKLLEKCLKIEPKWKPSLKDVKIHALRRVNFITSVTNFDHNCGFWDTALLPHYRLTLVKSESTRVQDAEKKRGGEQQKDSI